MRSIMLCLIGLASCTSEVATIVDRGGDAAPPADVSVGAPLDGGSDARADAPGADAGPDSADAGIDAPDANVCATHGHCVEIGALGSGTWPCVGNFSSEGAWVCPATADGGELEHPPTSAYRLWGFGLNEANCNTYCAAP